MRLRIDHAASIPMTVVLPVPVAILQALAHEGAGASRSGLEARLIPRNFRDASLVILLGLDQKYDRLSGFDLREEEPLQSARRCARGPAVRVSRAKRRQ